MTRDELLAMHPSGIVRLTAQATATSVSRVLGVRGHGTIGVGPGPVSRDLALAIVHHDPAQAALLERM